MMASDESTPATSRNAAQSAAHIRLTEPSREAPYPLEKLLRNLDAVHPDVPRILTSARTGEGWRSGARGCGPAGVERSGFRVQGSGPNRFEFEFEFDTEP